MEAFEGTALKSLCFGGSYIFRGRNNSRSETCREAAILCSSTIETSSPVSSVQLTFGDHLRFACTVCGHPRNVAQLPNSFAKEEDEGNSAIGKGISR